MKYLLILVSFVLASTTAAKSFVEYCEDERLPVEQRVFVDAVLDRFDTDDCGLVQDQVNSSGSLLLQGRGVTDITPIQGFESLVFIDLSWNKIADFSPIAKLSDVTSLAVRHCGITDIMSLLTIKGLTHLDLTANALTSLKGIDALQELRALKIGEMTIRDLTMIPRLKHLEHLKVGFTQSHHGASCDGPKLVTTGLIDSLDKLTGLRTLIATRMGIKSTEKIEALSELKVLDLTCNDISETDVFNKLPNLRELFFGHNALEKIAVAESNATVSKLGLRGNKLTDSSVPALAKLNRLHQLNLDHNQISDLSFARSAPRLASLRISHNRVRDVAPLYESGNFVEIVADHNLIEHIDFAKFQAPVLGLQFNHNAITKIVGVDQLSEIESLGLGGNPIEDLTPLNSLRPMISCISLNLSDLGRSDFRELTGDLFCRLNLAGNAITSVGGLPKSKRLYSLILSGNKLSSLDGILSQYPRLDKLSVAGNPISGLGPLADSGLSVLDISRTKIRDLTEVATLTEVAELRVAGLGLTSLAPIAHLNPRLLDVSHNKIADLGPMRGQFPRLQSLDLSQNRIGSLVPIKDIGHFRFALNLQMANNPLGSTVAKNAANCPLDGSAHAVRVWCSLR